MVAIPPSLVGDRGPLLGLVISNEDVLHFDWSAGGRPGLGCSFLSCGHGRRDDRRLELGCWCEDTTVMNRMPLLGRNAGRETTEQGEGIHVDGINSRAFEPDVQNLRCLEGGVGGGGSSRGGSLRGEPSATPG